MGTTIESRITSTQAKDAIYKAHSISSSANEIDDAIANYITQAELDAIVLDSGNLTPEQAAIIDGMDTFVDTIKQDDNESLYSFIDKEDKVLISIKKDGFMYDSSGNKIGEAGGASQSEYSTHALPFKSENSVQLLDISDEGAIQFSIPIQAYPNITTGIRPSKYITNDSLTHPKVIFIPSGWNGYSYWMAVTPYFGSSYGEESENPHILCSHDGINWVQTMSSAIDLPSASPEYFSDTHLILGYDNYLYCLYRAVGFADPIGANVYYKKSIDGVNWSSRTLFTPSADVVSPVLIEAPKHGYLYYDVNALSGNISQKWIDNIKSMDNVLSTNYINIINKIWINKESTYRPWHIDIDRVGNLWLGLVQTKAVTSGFGNDIYLMYSGDGLNWTVIDFIFSNNDGYRSCIVPISYESNIATIDIYLSSTNGGIIKKLRTRLEVVA